MALPKTALDCALDELDRVTKEWRESELRSRDFQMMLSKICYRAKRGLDLTDALDRARDLLKREGTLSPLRKETTND